MNAHSTGLFHTRVSALINIHRLLPRRVIREALHMDIPLPSKEGFIRQILGWREFVRHVHRETGGFRHLPGGNPPVASSPGDAGFSRWTGRAWKVDGAGADPDGGACPNALDCHTPLPPAYWGEPSGLACLDRVVADVLEEGYSHHITRLMVLSNIASLLDVSPRELTDWFWSAYADAYDWVVEPNVLGMGTYALGDLMTTKPYVSGTPYIQRMSDYCQGCAFTPGKTCPLSPLYWAYLARHRQAFRGNPRMAMPLNALKKRDASTRKLDRRVFDALRERLAAGERLTPEAY
jgi:deoxyribodipyrimidine photolyase-related protein